MDWLRKFKKRRAAGATTYKTADLETLAERDTRWRSLRIIYFTTFMMSMGFSIILTGVWPYLDKLDPHAGKEFLGFVVAANPVGQMLFSPIFGFWHNRSSSVRVPMLCSLALFMLASAGYSLLEFVSMETVRYWMVGTRFLVGVSSANIAVCRAYVSAATTLTERTGAISMVSLSQVLGFIVGPGSQMLVTPLGDRGFPLLGDKLWLNMYTATGWMNVALSLFNFILFLPIIFRDQRIATREAMRDHGAALTEKETWSETKPDYMATWSLILAFFVLVLDFVLLETLGTTLVMDQFAWTKQQALYYMGWLMAGGGVVAVITFIALRPLCRWFDERNVLLFGGFVFMVLGRALYFPWGSGPAQLLTPSDAEMAVLNNTEPVGCPIATQSWCAYTPGMTIAQLLIGYVATSIGYTIGVTLIQTLFSKVLGPRPQGVWMGWLTGSGCLARMMGPVFVAYIYVEFGTIWTFSFSFMLMSVCLAWLWLVRSRLVPLLNRRAVSHGDYEEELQSLS